MSERQRQRRRRRVPVVADAVDDAFRIQPEPFTDGGEDAAVGLVIDEQVDLPERDPGGGGRLLGRHRQAIDGLLVGLVAAHPDPVSVTRYADGARNVCLGAEHHRSDSGRLPGGYQHDRAGSVGEDGGGAPILRIGDRGT